MSHYPTDHTAGQYPAGGNSFITACRQFLITECETAFQNSRHTVIFPRAAGFSGPIERHDGVVFLRALVIDALLDGLQPPDDLKPLIEQQTALLLESRRTTGCGGWSYFPDLRELPPDADDLAQVIQAFVRAQRRDLVTEYCEEPLAVLLTDNAHPSGAFDTWIIPASRDADSALQAQWAVSAWGLGPDVEVVSNMIFALGQYDADRFATVISRAAAYVLDAQSRDGSWSSTWYHGRYYGTWVCLRAVNASPLKARTSIAKAEAFLRHSQNADGGWGAQQSDAVSTACALLAWAELGELAERWGDNAHRGLDWLASIQFEDGGLPRAPFVRMEVGRPTGTVVKTMSYGSRAVSALLALKAAVAMHRVTDL